MGRFHYPLKQKLQVLNLVETAKGFCAAEQFPRVTQKQLEEWKASEPEMKALTSDEQNRKCTLNHGRKRKYKLYQFLYQIVKSATSHC